MTPDLQTWASNIPWGQVAVVVAVVVLFGLSSWRSRRNRAGLAAVLAAGAKVIDVRSKGEFAGGHYQGAVNIPVDTLASKAKGLGAPDQALVVYCASGARSAQAAGILKSAGFTNVTNAGGLASMPK